MTDPWVASFAEFVALRVDLGVDNWVSELSFCLILVENLVVVVVAFFFADLY